MAIYPQTPQTPPYLKFYISKPEEKAAMPYPKCLSSNPEVSESFYELC